jgi:hypothetical protein
VKKLGGHLDVGNLYMHSWESNSINVNITNTGSFETAYTVLAILISDTFLGIYLDDGALLSSDYLKYKSTSLISPGNTKSIEFGITTRWSGGKIHFFLFNETEHNLIKKIQTALNDVINNLKNSIEPDSDLIFNSINSIIGYVLLSYGTSEISFEKAEEIIGADVIKSKDYYYGDGSDEVKVTLNMTVQKGSYEFTEFVTGWLWEDRQMNVTIYKNNIFIIEKTKKLTLLDDFQLDPLKKNYEFPIYIGENYGYGKYKFNVSLVVQDNNGIYRTIDEYQIQKEIQIKISDAEIIEISPYVLPIDTNNNIVSVKIKNIGNITQKFNVFIFDNNDLLDKWLDPGILPPYYTITETSALITPNSNEILFFYVDSRINSVNGYFKVYIEPNVANNELDSIYHWINVGPEISYFYSSSSTSSPDNDTKHFTNRGYYIFCDVDDQNTINNVELIYDFDGELINNYSGKISMNWISGNKYRSITSIPERVEPGKVIVSINASDNQQFQGYSNYTYYFVVEYDSNDTIGQSHMVPINSWWEESLGFESDDFDYFKVYTTFSPGRVIFINLTVPGLCDFDLKLYDKSQTFKTSSMKSGSLDEQIQYPISEDGYIYICVSKYYGNGYYNISFEYGKINDAGDNFAQATFVTSGIIWSESIDYLLDPNDYFKIYLNSGEKIYANLTVPSGLDFDLYLYNTTEVPKDSSTGSWGVDESVSFTAVESGYYYVRVYAIFALFNYGDYDLEFIVI